MVKIILYSLIPFFSTIFSIWSMKRFTSYSKEGENINKFVVKQNIKLTVFEFVAVLILSLLDILLNLFVFFSNGSSMFLSATLSNVFVILFILMFFGCLNGKIIVQNDDIIYVNSFRKKYKYSFSDIENVEIVFIDGNKTLRIYFQNKKVIVSRIYDNLDLLEEKLQQSHVTIEEKW